MNNLGIKLFFPDFSNTILPGQSIGYINGNPTYFDNTISNFIQSTIFADYNDNSKEIYLNFYPNKGFGYPVAVIENSFQAIKDSILRNTQLKKIKYDSYIFLKDKDQINGIRTNFIHSLYKIPIYITSDFTGTPLFQTLYSFITIQNDFDKIITYYDKASIEANSFLTASSNINKYLNKIIDFSSSDIPGQYEIFINYIPEFPSILGRYKYLNKAPFIQENNEVNNEFKAIVPLQVGYNDSTISIPNRLKNIDNLPRFSLVHIFEDENKAFHFLIFAPVDQNNQNVIIYDTNDLYITGNNDTNSLNDAYISRLFYNKIYSFKPIIQTSYGPVITRNAQTGAILKIYSFVDLIKQDFSDNQPHYNLLTYFQQNFIDETSFNTIQNYSQPLYYQPVYFEGVNIQNRSTLNISNTPIESENQFQVGNYTLYFQNYLKNLNSDTLGYNNAYNILGALATETNKDIFLRRNVSLFGLELAYIKNVFLKSNPNQKYVGCLISILQDNNALSNLTIPIYDSDKKAQLDNTNFFSFFITYNSKIEIASNFKLEIENSVNNLLFKTGIFNALFTFYPQYYIFATESEISKVNSIFNQAKESYIGESIKVLALNILELTKLHNLALKFAPHISIYKPEQLNSHFKQSFESIKLNQRISKEYLQVQKYIVDTALSHRGYIQNISIQVPLDFSALKNNTITDNFSIGIYEPNTRDIIFTPDLVDLPQNIDTTIKLEFSQFKGAFIPGSLNVILHKNISLYPHIYTEGFAGFYNLKYREKYLEYMKLGYNIVDFTNDYNKKEVPANFFILEYDIKKDESKIHWLIEKLLLDTTAVFNKLYNTSLKNPPKIIIKKIGSNTSDINTDQLIDIHIPINMTPEEFSVLTNQFNRFSEKIYLELEYELFPFKDNNGKIVKEKIILSQNKIKHLISDTSLNIQFNINLINYIPENLLSVLNTINNSSLIKVIQKKFKLNI